MKMMAFNAACPLEIGDEIFVIGNNAYYLAPEVKITQRLWDALCTQAEKRMQRKDSAGNQRGSKLAAHNRSRQSGQTNRTGI